MPVSTRIIILFLGGILINLHLPLSGEWIQDVLHGFSNSKINFRHAFSILHLWKKKISSRSIVSHDIDTLDFSGQRGCHSLTCKIGHIPKKDKGACTASKHFKGYTRLYYISRKSLDTHIQANGIKKSWVRLKIWVAKKKRPLTYGCFRKRVYPQIIHFTRHFKKETIHCGVPQNFGNTHIEAIF